MPLSKNSFNKERFIMDARYIAEKDITAEELRNRVNSPLNPNRQMAFYERHYTDPRVNAVLRFHSKIQAFPEMESKLAGKIVEMYKNGHIKKGAQCYKEVLTQLDDFVNKFERINHIRSKCTKGCDICCKSNMITIGYPEAEIIKEYIESDAFSQEQRRMILDRIKEQAEIVAEKGFTLTTVTESTNNGALEENQMRKRYFELHLPCVFLHEGACLIHEVRPLDCWGFRQYASNCYCEAFNVPAAYSFSEAIRVLMGCLVQEYLCYSVVDSLPGMMKKVLLD